MEVLFYAKICVTLAGKFLNNMWHELIGFVAGAIIAVIVVCLVFWRTAPEEFKRFLRGL